MKKLAALALSAAMIASLAACGGGTTPSENPSGNPSEKPSESPAADYGTIALVTDVGTIDDESFNQACWQGVQAYGDAHNIEYTDYQPAADSNDDRMASIRQAVQDGAGIVVLPGFLFGEAIAQAQEQFPDTKFVAVDVAEADLGGATLADNAYCAVFGEEEAGYLAGYAAVKDGYTSLGFLGGVAVPAVVRFGQGYVQGADDAAEELGTNIDIKYTYGGQFFGDANITAKMEGWYQAGTEVVFACGGGIWTSAAEAALNNEGMVIGVDTDQHHLGNNENYAYNPFLTSAVKGLQSATEAALDKYFTGNWADLGGKIDVLDLQKGESYVGLPTAEESWCFKTFTVEEYEAVKAKIISGEIVIDDNVEAMPEVSANTNLTMIE